jgi:5-(hydroxymethyl)furfural/furfural oxidase
MRDPDVRVLRHEVFAAGYSRIVRRLNRPGRANVVLTNVLAGLLDGPEVLRRPLLRWGVAAGDTGETRLADAGWRARTVRARSFATYHPVGTCRIGHAEDLGAVVGVDGSVHGVAGLSVVDASIIPTIPRANTCLPVLMLAERCADLINARDS